jgi:hypothetical protein
MKLLLENWRGYLNEARSPCSIYRSGMCDAYAIAQHELTGDPIFLVQGKWWDDEWEEWATEPCHLVTMADGAYFDVDGKKTEEDLKQSCLFSGPVQEVEIIAISASEAREIFTVEGVHDEDVERAKEYIQNETPI